MAMLPFGLLVLILTPSTFATVASNSSAKRSNATTPFDPFQQFRLRVTPKPSDPVCCLIPLSSEPLPTTAEFLSFEEWKSKQIELQAHAHAAYQTLPPDAPGPEAPPGSPLAAETVTLRDMDRNLSSPTDSLITPSPHFRVPLTDRFNYASLDCSARVHTAHRSARSPSAILSSKKDRYMLSPCSASPNFFVVELCDDIRIDTVQLANFEFFSGVFRDFKVSVAQTYTSDGQGWVEAGIYQAKNIRGVQSFHPLVELRPFYRFIRIDFLTHYGNEFYCPISLLRVYGLTQMEEWKWEVWQGVSTASSLEFPEVTKQVNNETASQASATHIETISSVAESHTIAPAKTIATPIEDEHTLATLESHFAQMKRTQSGTSSTPVLQTSSVEPSFTSNVSMSSETATPLSASTTAVMEPSPNTSQEMRTETSLTLNSSYASSGVVNASSDAGSNASLSISTPASIPTVKTIVPFPSPPTIPSGESIFRTIMNRLAMLETNTTLYQKYVEEQTLQVREALRRLEEDVGRLEGISKAQQQVFSKTVNQLERTRRQMEDERWELLSKVNDLADEVMLEKRLGIAQLCLLLTVLVFMALTRGSRTDAVSLLDGTIHKLHRISRRSPWSSADWTSKRWASRSPTPTLQDFCDAKSDAEKGAQPVTISSPRGETLPAPQPKTPTTLRARSQTPRSHLRHPSASRQLGTPERPIGRLYRSNSHTTPANTQLSARRFARSAHLHEVHLFNRRRTKMNGRQGEKSDEESASDGSPRPRSRRLESPFGMMPEPGQPPSEAESWADTEPGSEPGADCEGTDSEELSGRDVEIESAYPTRRI